MQVPAQFQYDKATSVGHALTLLAKYGAESRVVAGGHSLLPMMKLRLAQPEALIDINDLDELAAIRIEDGELCLGAMVRHAALLDSAIAGELFPIFHDAERVIADPIVRNRGTIGGSICQADPSEDLSAAFCAVRATAVIEGLGGRRAVPVRDFLLGPYETALADGELLVEIRVPIESAASAYEKVDRRAGDWAVAAVGAAVRFSGETLGETLAEVGIGLTAVGATNFVAIEAEDFLRGGPATGERIAEAASIAAQNCNPYADQRGPVAYKRSLVATLTARALTRAVARWHGNRRES